MGNSIRKGPLQMSIKFSDNLLQIFLDRKMAELATKMEYHTDRLPSMTKIPWMKKYVKQVGNSALQKDGQLMCFSDLEKQLFV